MALLCLLAFPFGLGTAVDPGTAPLPSCHHLSGFGVWYPFVWLPFSQLTTD